MHRLKTFYNHIFRFWVFVVFLLFGTVAAPSSQAEGGVQAASAATAPNNFTPLQTIPKNAQQVVVGIYPLNAYNINIESSTYYLDAYVWFRWKGAIDPTQTVEFVNGVEDWGFTQQNILEKPSQLADGSFYQIMKIEGRFVQPFSLTNFPLDEHNLTILVEDTTYPSDQVVYIADSEDSGYGDMLKIAGWKIQGWRIESLLHHYNSLFGERGGGSQLSSTFAALRYSLTIERPLNYFIWKLFLPLFIVLAAHWVTYLLDPSMIDVRTATSATALLTIVFLQRSYTESLPEIGYLVLLDKIYVLAYLLIIITLCEVILTSMWWQKGEVTLQARVKRLDRTLLAVQIVSWIIGVALIIRMR